MGRAKRWARGIVAAAGLLSWSGGARGTPVLPGSADGFVDTIGVNVHATHYLGFATTSYDDWTSVVAVTKDLGVRNIRDHIFDVDRLNQITAATGAAVTAIMDQHVVINGIPTLDPTKLPDLIAAAKQLTKFGALEGPSEYNEYAPPDWENQLRSWQQTLYTTAKADNALKNVPVLAPTPGDVFSVDFADLAPYTDRGNMHSYTYRPLTTWLSQAAIVSGSKPVWSTETGYSSTANPSSSLLSLSAGAKLTPRLLMDQYAAGAQRTFLYELLDDNVDPNNTSQENHFGLYDANYVIKPAGRAVKNLIALLSDAGASTGFTPASLDYTVTGGNANLRQVLLQKSDGTYWLALWQDVPVFDVASESDLTNADLPITLTFGHAMPGAAVYLPDGSTTPLSTYGALSQLNVSVPDQVMLVEIVPEPGMGFVVIGVAGLLMRRRKTRA